MQSSTIPKTLWGNVVCATISIDEKLAIIGIFKGRLLITSLFVRTPLAGPGYGLERLLDRYCSSDPIEFLTYGLAASRHNTVATVRPISENLSCGWHPLSASFCFWDQTAYSATSASSSARW
jgi:hypothetical protein